jgi:hypothetical protein
MGHRRDEFGHGTAAACVVDATGRANWWVVHLKRKKPKVPIEDTV